jgi:hypothetical protein
MPMSVAPIRLLSSWDESRGRTSFPTLYFQTHKQAVMDQRTQRAPRAQRTIAIRLLSSWNESSFPWRASCPTTSYFQAHKPAVIDEREQRTQRAQRTIVPDIINLICAKQPRLAVSGLAGAWGSSLVGSSWVWLEHLRTRIILTVHESWFIVWLSRSVWSIEWSSMIIVAAINEIRFWISSNAISDYRSSVFFQQQKS